MKNSSQYVHSDLYGVFFTESKGPGLLSQQKMVSSKCILVFHNLSFTSVGGVVWQRKPHVSLAITQSRPESHGHEHRSDGTLGPGIDTSIVRGRSLGDEELSH